MAASATELEAAMEQCLRTKELVYMICDEADKRSALSMALACRAFLEPGLDSRWRHLTSFGPLVACLPEDLLQEETLSPDLRSRMMTLRRQLRASDLDVYLNRYAGRIRSFRPHPQNGKIWLSIEALQAIQVVTNYAPGALSPRLTAVQMTPPGNRTLSYLEDGFANRLAPCMALFVHPGVTCLEFSSFNDRPLYCTTVQNFTASITNLESLTIRVHRDRLPRYGHRQDGDFLQQYLTSFHWLHIKELNIVDGGERVYLECATLQHLSTLPLLSNLNLDGPHGCHSSEIHHVPPRNGSFPSLQRVTLGGVNILYLLGSLPATNLVMSMKCHSIFSKEEHTVFSAIGMHCNPLTLKKLEIKGRHIDRAVFQNQKEALEPPNEDLDIEPLLQFHLEFVDIRVSGPMQITPAQAGRFCTQWHSATHIHLFSLSTTTRSPSIDHTHVLAIAESCPALVHLGLRFDASRIRGDTVIRDFGYTHQLCTIYVGDSPIYSPAAVERFLGIAFPYLETVGYRSTCEWDTPIYKDRWSAVAGWYAERYES